MDATMMATSSSASCLRAESRLRRDDSGLFKQLKPEQRFIGFFFDIAEFGEKVRSGFCATSGAVIRRD